MNPEKKSEDTTDSSQTIETTSPPVESSAETVAQVPQEQPVEQSSGIGINKPDINIPKPNFSKPGNFGRPTASSDQTSSPSPEQMPPKKSKKTGLLILLVIIIVLGLAALAYLAMSEEDNSTQQVSNDQVAQVEEESESESNNDSPTDLGGENEGSSQTNDVELKNQISRMMAAIYEYIANNNGAVPNLSEVSSIVEPFSQNITVVDSDPELGQVQYKTSARCGEDGLIIEGTARQIVLRTLLSDGKYYCVE